MNRRKLPEEIRNDIKELFPTIFDISKHNSLILHYVKKKCQASLIHPFLRSLDNLFYNLSNELTLTTMNNDAFVSDEYYQKEFRWRISLATLKRLDSINRDWSVTPSYSIPNLYNEKPLFLEESDRTILDECENNAQTSSPPSHLLQYNSDSNTTTRFLPKKNLDDFKIIQSCLKNQQKPQQKQQLCELDNTRFKFG